MKIINIVALAVAFVAALPRDMAEKKSTIQTRQLGITRNELQSGGPCPRVIFIFARGSTELGNMVRSMYHGLKPSKTTTT